MSLIYFDIDGTLTDWQFTVPGSTVRAVRRARENGHVCVVNTGRPYTHIDPHVRAISFDGYACSCGMHIILNGETLLHESFSPEFSRMCVAENRRHHVLVIYESEEGMFFDPTMPMTPYLEHSHDHFGKTGLPVDGDIDAPGFFFDKFAAWATPETDVPSYLAFLKEHFDPIVRGEGFFEVVAKGFSKKTAMDRILQETGIPFADTYAIGDSLNDLLMLENVQHPIAMGNALPEVKSRSEYVTADVTEDGVEQALRHYGLI